MKETTFKDKKNKTEIICVCPTPTDDKLKMNTVLYYGFGGYTVKKNGELFYEGDPQGEWDSFKKLRDIEKEAKEEPKSKWEVILYDPLNGATWTRNRLKKGEWILTETNEGFA